MPSSDRSWVRISAFMLEYSGFSLKNLRSSENLGLSFGSLAGENGWKIRCLTFL